MKVRYLNLGFLALFVLTIKYSSGGGYTAQVSLTALTGLVHVQVMPYVRSELSFSFRCMQVRYLSLGFFAMFVRNE